MGVKPARHSQKGGLSPCGNAGPRQITVKYRTRLIGLVAHKGSMAFVRPCSLYVLYFSLLLIMICITHRPFRVFSHSAYHPQSPHTLTSRPASRMWSFAKRCSCCHGSVSPSCSPNNDRQAVSYRTTFSCWSHPPWVLCGHAEQIASAPTTSATWGLSLLNAVTISVMLRTKRSSYPLPIK